MDENNMNKDFETGNNDREYVTAEEPQVETLGLLQRIACVFAAPTKLMENIQEKPKVLLPLLILVILALPYAYLSLASGELYTIAMDNYSLERYGMAYSALTGDVGQGNVVMTMASTFLATIAVNYLLGGLIAAFVLWLVCKAFKGSGKFKMYFSMFLHIYIVTTVVGMVSAFLMGQFNTLTDFLSLAAVLAPNGSIADFSFLFFSTISVATVWSAVLTGIGVRAINGFSTTKAGAIAAAMFVLSTLFAASIAYAGILSIDLAMSAITAM